MCVCVCVCRTSPWASSAELDNKETFPLFGRVIPSQERGLSVPLIHWLQQRNVAHLGLVHWNDALGNEFARALRTVATDLYPTLQVATATLPSKGATEDDYRSAIAALAKTEYRWFYVVVGHEVRHSGFLQTYLIDMHALTITFSSQTNRITKD